MGRPRWSTSRTRLATSSSWGTVPGSGPVVVVHGGAWDIPTARLGEHREGMERALRLAARAVERGASALKIAEESVIALENHPAFDAGRGSVLDRDGAVQLDAGLMDGPSLRWGAVAGVRALPNPIRAARAVLNAAGQARLLVAEGAERFAAEVGLPAVDPSALVVERERERFERMRAYEAEHPRATVSGEMDVPRGTVGCVVRDHEGRLAAATSTGGAPLTRPGRVGDSPIPGAGYFADATAAASATGWGEAILTAGLARDAVGRVATGTPAGQAAQSALDRMSELVRWPGASRATGGLIIVDADGHAGWAFTTPRMARGAWRPGGEIWTAVDAA